MNMTPRDQVGDMWHVGTLAEEPRRIPHRKLDLSCKDVLDVRWRRCLLQGVSRAHARV